MSPLDPAISEMWAIYRAHYPDPHRPVHSALVEACIRRLQQLCISFPTSSVDPADWISIYPEVQRLTDEMKELLSYIGENPLFISTPPGEFGDFLVQQGISFAEAQKTVESVQEKGPGRPTSARVRAVAALDLKKVGKLSWQQIAVKHCPCGEARHGRRCAERFRIAVLELQKRLSEWNISIPDPL